MTNWKTLIKIRKYQTLSFVGRTTEIITDIFNNTVIQKPLQIMILAKGFILSTLACYYFNQVEYTDGSGMATLTSEVWSNSDILTYDKLSHSPHDLTATPYDLPSNKGIIVVAFAGTGSCDLYINGKKNREISNALDDTIAMAYIPIKVSGVNKAKIEARNQNGTARCKISMSAYYPLEKTGVTGTAIFHEKEE